MSVTRRLRRRLKRLAAARIQEAPKRRRAFGLEPLEPRLLLSADLAPFREVLDAGFTALGQFGDRIDQSDELSARLPLQQSTLGDQLDVGAILRETLAAPAADYLDSTADPTDEGLAQAFRDALVGDGLAIDARSVMLTDEDHEFAVSFTVTRTVEAIFDLAAATALNPIAIEGSFTKPLALTYSFDATFGLDPTAPDGLDAFFIDFDSGNALSARLVGDIVVPAFADGRVGLLGLSTSAGTIEFELDLGFDFSSAPAGLGAAELMATPLGDFLDVQVGTPVGATFRIALPFAVNLDGFVLASEATIAIQDDNLFDGVFDLSDPFLVLEDADEVLAFRQVSAAAVEGALQQLEGLLSGFAGADVLQTEIPFTDGMTLADVLDVGEAFQSEVLDRVTTLAADASSGFDTVQELAALFGETVGYEADSDGDLDTYDPALLLNLRLDHVFELLEVDLAIGDDLGDLNGFDIDANSKLGIDAELALTFQFGVIVADVAGGRALTRATRLSEFGLTLDAAGGSDLAFTTRSGSAFSVNLDSFLVNTGGDPTLDLLLNRINNAARATLDAAGDSGDFLLVINDAQSGFDIRDSSFIPLPLGLRGTLDELSVSQPVGSSSQVLTALGLGAGSFEFGADETVFRGGSINGRFALTLNTDLASLNGRMGAMPANDEGDLRITLTNGTSFDVLNLAGLTSVSDLLTAVHEAAEAVGIVTPMSEALPELVEFEFGFNPDRTGFQLVDATSGAAGSLRVQGLNGSLAAAGLGIAGQGISAVIGEFLNPTTIQVIEGGPLHGRSFLDNVFVRQLGNDPMLRGAASLRATDIDATVNFGFIELAITDGTAVGQLEGSFSIEDPGSAGPNDPITLMEGFEALGMLEDYVVFPSLDGSAFLDLPVSVGLDLAGLDIGASASIGLSLPDLSLPDLSSPDAFVLDLGPLGNLPDLGELSLSSVIDGLRGALDLLAGLDGLRGLSFLDDDLPLIGLNLGDILDVAGSFGDIVASLEANPATALGQVEDLLESLLGGGEDLVELSLDQSPGGELALRIDLDLALAVTEQGPLSVDLSQLGMGGVTDLVDVSGQGMVALDAAALAALSIGFDFSDPDNTRPFLYDFNQSDNTGTRLELTADASASNIDFSASIGPLGAEIENASVSLSGAGSAPARFVVLLANAPADGRHYLDSSFPLGLADFDVEASGNANVTLPISLPQVGLNSTLTVTVPDLSDPTDINVVGGDLLTQALAGLSGGLPEDFDLLAMVGGWEGAFDLLIDALQGEVFGIEIPLIGDALADEASFLEDIKDRVLDNLRGDAEQGRTGPSEIQLALFDALGPGGLGLLQDAVNDDPNVVELTPDDVVMTIQNDGGSFDGFQYDIHLAQDLLSLELPLGFDIGIPGLNFDLDAPVLVEVGFDLRFGVGVTLSDGFYLVTGAPTDDPEIQIFLDVSVPGLSAQGELAFLRVNAEDIATDRMVWGEAGSLESQIVITSVNVNDSLADLRVVVANQGAPGVSYDENTRTLTLGIAAGSTTAQSLIAAINSDADVSMLFAAAAPIGASGLGLVSTSATTSYEDNLSSNFAAVFGVDLRDPSAGQGGSDDDERLSLGEIFQVDGFSDIVDVSADGAANVNLALLASLGGSANFPSLRTDLGLSLDFGLGTGISEPVVSFSRVELNLGEFFGNFVDGTLSGVQGALAPVQPILDVLTSRVPVISDLAGQDITFVDLAGLFGGGTASVAGFINGLDQVSTILNSLPDLGPDSWINFGSATLARNASGELDFQFDLDGGILGALDRDGLFNQLNDAAGTGTDGFDAAMFIPDPQDVVAADTARFSFPILSDPTSVFGLLTGRVVDFFALELPTFEFSSSFSRSYPVPAFPVLSANIGGRVAATLDFAFGYDSSGLQRFFESGDFEDVFDGFFVADRENVDGTGADIPEVSVSATLMAGASLDLGLISASVSGGITGVIDFNLNDPNNDGRVRALELLENFSLGPIHLFDVSGRVEAGLTVSAEIGFSPFSFTESFDIARVTLLSFDIPRPDTNAVPLAEKVDTTVGSTLMLNIGPRASLRANSIVGFFDPSLGEDGDEDFRIRAGSTGDSVIVEAFGREQEYTGISRIFADAGQGNDSIVVADDVLIPVEFYGGVGNDTLTGGAGNDLLFGGSSEPSAFVDGDDVLRGGDGDDVLRGGAGRDTLLGDAGRDLLMGGSESDTLDGGSDQDTLLGEAGNDQLRGGSGDDDLRGGLGADFLMGDSGADELHGGEGPDELRGGRGADLLFGNAGTDTLLGDDGLDELHGGDDADFLVGGSGNDTLFGEAGNDRLLGENGRDELWGGAGNDVLLGGGAGDELFGGQGDDRLFASDEQDSRDESSNLLVGGSGSDWIRGGSGDDEIRGDGVNSEDVNGVPIAGLSDQDGADTIFAFGGADLVLAGGGNDLVYGGLGPDVLYGGVGDDRLYATDDANTADPDTTSVHTLVGGAGSDVILGHIGNDVIFGDGANTQNGVPDSATDGSDTIYGFAGDDVIETGDGDNVVFAGAGNDVVTAGAGNDSLHGDGDDDFLVGGLGDDEIEGGSGNDALFGGAAVGTPDDYLATADFERPLLDPDEDPAHADELTHVIIPALLAGAGVAGSIDDGEDTLLGGAGGDWLFGGGMSDRLEGGDDQDYLDAGAGRDVLIGNGGDDVLRGGDNDDFFAGGSGIDLLYGEGGSDRLFGGSGVGGSQSGQRLFGGTGADFLFAFALETSGTQLPGDELYGGADNDVLRGNVRQDLLSGGSGNDFLGGDILAGPSYLTNSQADTDGANDVLLGGSGEDQLFGGGGDDTLWGGVGTDRLDGQMGSDTQYGGSGIDLFVLPTNLGTANGLDPAGIDVLDGHFGNAPSDNTPDDGAIDIAVVDGTNEADTILISQNPDGTRVRFDYRGTPFFANFKDELGNLLVEQIQIAGLGGNDVIGFAMSAEAAAAIGRPELAVPAGAALLDLTALAERTNQFVGVFDGNAGNDTLLGGAGRDRLDGGRDDDLLFGFGGDDRLFGDSGDGASSDTDLLFAGQGNDDLLGGQGNNELYAWSLDPDLGRDVVLAGPSESFGIFVDENGDLAFDDGDGDGDGFVDGLLDMDGEPVPAYALEDTGLNRMIGGTRADVLYGGTVVDFLYGGGGGDTLIRADGSTFESLDGDVLGDEWKDYARESDRVWYISGSNAADEISIDLVTEPGLLAGHHLVTRLTENNGLFSFAAQVRLDFDAVDSDGQRIWDDSDEVFEYDALRNAQDDDEARADALENSGMRVTPLVEGLLPPEDDFLVIVVDALAGNDVVIVGPTVEKSVWIDGGAGDDRIEIRSGQSILPDQTESVVGTTGVRGRNDAPEQAFMLPRPGAALQQATFTGLSIDNPADVDWYRFDLATAFDGTIEIRGASPLDELTLTLFDVGDPPEELASGETIDLSARLAGTYLLRVESNDTPTRYDLRFDLGNIADAPVIDLATTGDAIRRDVILGGAGNDILLGGSGEDFIFGNDGNDVLSGGLDRQASDFLLGGAGNDTFQIIPDELPLLGNQEGTLFDPATDTFIPTASDQMIGGDGEDRVLFLGGDFDRSGLSVRDDVALRYNTGLHRYEFTSLVWDIGTQEFRTDLVDVNGNGIADPGELTLFQQHFLFYQTRDVEQTVIATGGGDDVVHADPGFRYLPLSGSFVPELFEEWGIDPGDFQQGATEAALTILGGDGNDQLYGGALSDVIDGGAGNDVIVGGFGDDVLRGGSGNDRIDGLSSSQDGPDLPTLPAQGPAERFVFELAAPFQLAESGRSDREETSFTPAGGPALSEAFGLEGNFPFDGLSGIRPAGDFNDDGFEDFFAIGIDRSYLLFGPVDLGDLENVNDRAQIVIDHSALGQPGERFGDVNADGISDLVFVRPDGADVSVRVVFGAPNSAWMTPLWDAAFVSELDITPGTGAGQGIEIVLTATTASSNLAVHVLNFTEPGDDPEGLNDGVERRDVLVTGISNAADIGGYVFAGDRLMVTGSDSQSGPVGPALQFFDISDVRINVTDLDSDGQDELATTGSDGMGGQTVFVEGITTGALPGSPTIAGAPNLELSVLGDIRGVSFNPDGFPELAFRSATQLEIIGGGSPLDLGSPTFRIIITAPADTEELSAVTGDWNADGRVDLALAAIDSSLDDGTVYIFWSVGEQPSLDAAADADVAIPVAGLGGNGSLTPDSLQSLDLDGDGIEDLLIAAPGASSSGVPFGGVVYAIFGAGATALPEEFEQLANFSVPGSGAFVVDRGAGRAAIFQDGDQPYFVSGADEVGRWFQFTTLGDGSLGDAIHIVPDSPLGRVEATLFREDGAVVARGAAFDLRGLKAGSYFLNVTTTTPSQLFRIEFLAPRAGATHPLGDRDWIDGGEGADTLEGNGGLDRIAGGGGFDSFTGEGLEIQDSLSGEQVNPAAPGEDSVATTPAPVDPILQDPFGELGIADNGLREAIGDALGLPTTVDVSMDRQLVGEVRASDLAGIARLNASFLNVSDLRGLQNLLNLETLELRGNGNLSDFNVSPLDNFRDDDFLRAVGDNSTELVGALVPLAELSRLRVLRLEGTTFSGDSLNYSNRRALGNLDALEFFRVDTAPISAVDNLAFGVGQLAQITEAAVGNPWTITLPGISGDVARGDATQPITFTPQRTGVFTVNVPGATVSFPIIVTEAAIAPTLIDPSLLELLEPRLNEGSSLDSLFPGGSGVAPGLEDFVSEVQGGSNPHVAIALEETTAQSSLFFDGANDSLRVPNQSIDGVADLTLAFWLSTDNAGAQTLFHFSGFGGFGEFQISLMPNDQVQLSMTSFSGISGTLTWTLDSSITDGEFHHVVVSMGSPTVAASLVVDGVTQQQVTGTLPAFINLSGTDIRVGNGSAGAFAGRIDELSIWDFVLSAEQVRDFRQESPVGDEPGLRAHYTFDDGVGLIATDRAGNFDALLGEAGLTAVDTSPRWSTVTRFPGNAFAGERGGIFDLTTASMSFNGLDQFVAVDSPVDFIGGNYTVETWFRSDAVTEEQFLVSGNYVRLFATQGEFDIVELHPATGQVLNRFAAPSRSSGLRSALAFDGEHLFFIEGDVGFGEEHTLYELDPDSGEVIDADVIGMGTFGGMAALDGLIYILDARPGDVFDLIEFDPLRDRVIRTVTGGFLLDGGIASIESRGTLLLSSSNGIFEFDPATVTLTGRLGFFLSNASMVTNVDGLAVVGDEIYVSGQQGIARYDANINARFLGDLPQPTGGSLPNLTASGALAGSQLGTVFELSLSPGAGLRFTQEGTSVTGGTFGSQPGELGDGEWHHVAAVREGDTLRLYLDGAVVGTTPFTATDQSDLPLSLTFGRGSGGMLEGSLDEIQIWSRARTAVEIGGDDETVGDRDRGLDGTEQDLVSYWSFNDGVGEIVQDRGPNGSDGELRGPPRLRPVSVFASGTGVLADVDGDNVDDLVVVNPAGDTVSVSLGFVGGTFGDPLVFAVGDGPRSVTVSNVDNGNTADVVIANEFSDDVSVLFGNGDGTFQPAVSFAAGDAPSSIVVANLDENGGPTYIIVANELSDDVTVVRVNFSGGFDAVGSFPVGDAPSSIVVVDLNNDLNQSNGGLDLVVVNRLGNNGSVLLGNGNGGFEPDRFPGQAALTFALPPGSGPVSVVVARLDGDTNDDLAIANELSGDVTVLFGIGDGTFQNAQSFATGILPSSVAVIDDVNGDGFSELVAGSDSSNELSLLFSTGGGAFEAGQSLEAEGPVTLVQLDTFPTWETDDVPPPFTVPMFPSGEEGFFVLTITATDDDGLVSTGQRRIEIVNVAPVADVVVTEAPASSLPIQTLDAGATIDPGDRTDLRFVWVVTREVTRAVANDDRDVVAEGSGETFSFTPEFAGSYDWTLTVTDPSGASDIENGTIVVNPISQISELSEAALVGDVLRFDSTGSSELAPLDVAAGLFGGTRSYAWRAMRGATTVALSSDPEFAFVPESAGSYSIELVITDDVAGGVRVSSLANLANVIIGGRTPTIVVPAGPLAEGDFLEFTATDLGLLPPVGASGDLTTTDRSFAWTATPLSGGAAILGFGSSFVFQPRDDGMYAIDLTVTDQIGSFTVVSVASQELVSVANTAPTINASDSEVTFEGEFTLDLVLLEPGADDALDVTINWGDGSNEDSFQIGAGAFSPTHTYANQVSPYTVTITASDGQDATVANLDVEVLNASPVIESFTSDFPVVNDGGGFRLSGFIFDPGPGPLLVTIDFGDGTRTGSFSPFPLGEGRFVARTGEHVYADSGVHEATLTVIDAEGAISRTTATVVVGNDAPQGLTLDAQALIGDSGNVVRFSGSFSDYVGDADSLLATLDFGDGTTLPLLLDPTGLNGTQQNFGFDVAYIYDSVGSFGITLTVRDADGDSANTTASFSVLELVDGDYDGDGVAQASDFAPFVADFAIGRDGGGGTDLNNDGRVDIDDFNRWLELLAAPQAAVSASQDLEPLTQASLQVAAELSMFSAALGGSSEDLLSNGGVQAANVGSFDEADAFNIIAKDPATQNSVSRPSVEVARSARVAPSATFGTHVSVYARAEIGEDTHIGDRSSVGGGARIGERVRIGSDVTIEAGAVIPDDSVVIAGSNVASADSADRAERWDTGERRDRVRSFAKPRIDADWIRFAQKRWLQ